MLKQLIVLLFLLSYTFLASSQLQPVLDQYYLNGLAINPAYAGSQEALSVGLFSRNQWVGFEGAPKTYTFSMHSPMRNRKVNLGLMVYTDSYGSRRETGFVLNYAYRMDLGAGKLSLGLAAGITGLSSDLNAIRFINPGDQLLQDPGRKWYLPQFSFGSYYYTDRYYIGVSMPLFTSHPINEETGEYRIGFNPSAINYMVVAGYLFRLSDEFELLPSFLFKTVPANDTQLDLNASVIYKEKIWLGTSIRTNGNLSAILQVQIKPQLRVGYSYGYEISELSSYQKGSHELMLLYRFRYTIDVVSPRYF